MKKNGVVRKRAVYRRFRLAGDGLSDGKRTDELCFSEGKNCEVSEGGLRRGVGVIPFVNDEGQPIVTGLTGALAGGCFCPARVESEEYAVPSFCLMTGAGKFYLFNEETGEFILCENAVFSAESTCFPVYLEGEEARYAVVGRHGVFVVDKSGGVSAITAERTTKVGAFFHGRIFYTDGFAIAYSAPFSFEPTADNADDKGKIELGAEGGEIVGIVPLGERLIVVREYGLLALRAAGAARDFVVEKLPYDGGRVEFGSVCAVGEKVFFLAENAVYSLSGDEVKRALPTRPEELTDAAMLRASACEGRYRLGFTDAEGEIRSLLVGADGEYYLSFGVSGLYGGSETVGAVNGTLVRVTEAGELPSGEDASVFADGLEFGKSGEKVLRKIRLFGRGSVGVRVTSERGERSFTPSVRGNAEEAFSLRGRAFGLELRPAAGAKVEAVEFVYDALGGK